MQKNAEQSKHTNRLIEQSSPYLQQHSHNPVDWYPWCDEAFEKARKQGKPVFLSSGYSTCHWCHVMERESFEDEHIAQIMNRHFVNIKVDKEERPDIDSLYMNAVQAITGMGGWPLSVFMTPEGKPFYGGSYFPKRSGFGRPGFEQVLLGISDAWQNRRDELLSSSNQISQLLNQINRFDQPGRLSTGILKKAYDALESSFDEAFGGFGGAPKFPQPGNFLFLLVYHQRTGSEKALQMVCKTLKEMAKGGIYDHLGGGFHRYSTDSKWHIPHFEKMLYDQALIVRIYLQTYQVTGDICFKEVAEKNLDYVLRELCSSEGGFYSGEDADSEGGEGKFYVWSPGETEAVLGKKKAAVFNRRYGVRETGDIKGKSVLRIKAGIDQISRELNMNKQEVEREILASRRSLLDARRKRPRSNRDEKIITGWNGLMIGTLALGGTVLRKVKYIQAAQRCASFLLERVRIDERLARYHKENPSKVQGFLEDYVFLTMGLLKLYEADFDIRWMEEAESLAENAINLFKDPAEGGFFRTAADAEKLMVRDKSRFDGAIPSGNSVAASVLLRLGRLTMKEHFTQAGESVLKVFSGLLRQTPTSLSWMLNALHFYLGPTQEIVITGNRKQAAAFADVAGDYFLPNALLVFHPDNGEGKRVEQHIPFVKEQIPIGGRTCVYLCENYACKQPVIELDEFRNKLTEISKPPLAQ